MTQQPISEMEAPQAGEYKADDREGIDESRKAALDMVAEYEDQRWGQLMNLLSGFEDKSGAEKLAFYQAKEPGMSYAVDAEWEMVITGLTKFYLLKDAYPDLAAAVAGLAPWLAGQAALGRFPAQEAVKTAREYRRLLREAGG